MPQETDHLACDDAALLADCNVDIYKSSGPGGQHRNKVCSAVRLRHKPTGVISHGDESRSQHDNKQAALRRLRMNIACQVRRPLAADAPILPVVTDCIRRLRKADPQSPPRLTIGVRDRRFWQVAAFLLDVLDSYGAGMGESAKRLGITTSNLGRILRSERHLFTAAQRIRQHHGRGPLA